MEGEALGKAGPTASLLVAVLVTVVFYIAAEQMNARSEGYTPMDVYGGTVFVLILSVIVSLSLIPSLLRRFARPRWGRTPK